MKIRKDSNLKILKNANYQTEKQIDNIKYPDLYAHRYGYNNNSKINNFSSNKMRISSSNSKQLSRTSSDFFERNYNSYLDKIFSKKNFVNSSMISETELNSLLYKLKKYNNEVMTYTSKKEEYLNHLRNTLKQLEYKFSKLKELQDIELPDEKISVKNFNELKMSKADIEQKLFLMMEEKQEIDYSLKNEQEYNKTIEYMFEDEQNRLLSIKRETNIIEQKLYNVGKYQKIVSDNITKNEKKNKNYEELNEKIDSDLKLIDNANNKQNMTNQKLDQEIMIKEKEVQILEEQIKQLKESNHSDINDYKQEIKEEIEQAKEMHKKKIEDEKKYIEVINCLYIIQKYFTEAEEFDKEQLLASKDYNLLVKMNEEYITTYTDTKKNFTENTFIKKENYSSKNKREINRAVSSVNIKRNYTNNTTSQEDKKSFNTTHNKINSASNIKQNKSFKINANKTSSTFFNTKLDINNYYNNDKSNIEELIDKFNEIKLTKQILFDYNSSLMSKLNFYRTQLNDFHFKEINLEGMKKTYETKVNNIISNNYFDFEELTKYNEKCEKFLEDNEYFINKMKKSNNKKKMTKIIERINKDNYVKEESDSEEEKLDNIPKEEKKKINIDDIAFKSSKNVIMSVNNFFLTCTDLIKDIIVLLNNLNDQNGSPSGGDKKNIYTKVEEDNSLFMKENNITDEESDNPFIEALKKLVEYQKNKEINISKDYKLLIQYIKSLIRYIENKPINEFNLDINELKNDLLNKFYKIGENQNQKIDKLFVRRFLSKKSPNFNNIFNNFTLLLNPTLENIKLIYNLIHNESSKKYVDNCIKNKAEIIQKISSNKKINQPMINNENLSKYETVDNEINFKSINKYRRLSSSKSEINKNEELCYDEEDADSSDTQSTKKKIIKIKRKVKSIDEKIIHKLYTPFLEKTVYLRKLNPNIPGIKQMTSNSSKHNFAIKKMINDVDTISYQMKVYNNPFLDPNKLSDNTYNSIVRVMLNDSNKNKSKKKIGLKNLKNKGKK